MKILADENLHAHFVKKMVEEGFEVIRIAENHGGVPDEKVIDIVKQHEGILITEDKDFGELVFAHRITKITVVFLRYRKPELEKMTENLSRIVKEYCDKEGQYFIVITSTRIRIRQI